MREMKDSGIQWIGSVPQEWGISNIGGMYALRNEKVSDRDYQPLSVTKQGVLPQLENVAKTDAHDDRKLVRVGDFAINSRSDRRGSCGISDYDGSVSLINTVLCPRNKMNPRYYNWLFHTVQFADEFYKQGHGIVDDLWTTRWQDMKRIQVPQPSLDEQAVIANFLDTKCAEIDALMADIQAQIDTLERYKRSVITEAVTKGIDPTVEMKDSGILWLEKICKEWKSKRLRYLCSIATGNDDTQNADPDGIYPFYVRSPKVEKSNNYTFDGEGILVAGDGAGAGRVFHHAFGKYAVHQRVYRLAGFKPDVNPSYLFYYISSFFPSVMDMGSAQSTVPSIRLPMLLDFQVFMPCVEQQRQIVCFLDAKCAEIDACIATKKEQSSILEAYKKSLIYEYVTGKKEIVV